MEQFSRGCAGAYDHAAMQAIRFLQGIYGFVVRDYNYASMRVYRETMRSAILVVVCAARYSERLEREASVRPVGQGTLDWNLLCSYLMASMSGV